MESAPLETGDVAPVSKASKQGTRELKFKAQGTLAGTLSQTPRTKLIRVKFQFPVRVRAETQPTHTRTKKNNEKAEKGARVFCFIRAPRAYKVIKQKNR